MTRIFLFLAGMLLPGLAMAQHIELRGYVMDAQADAPLEGVTVRLTTLADSLLGGAITSDSGRFVVHNLPAGKIVLYLELDGFDSLRQEFDLPADMPVVELGTAKMASTSVLVDGIVIRSEVPPLIQRGDTAEYNADAFKTQPDATTEDLLRKMPGVVVKDGEVEAQGEKITRVLVDGKPFMGDDAKAALKNLPAEAIQKVQVYDRKSDQARFTGFDDGETEKTLNIVTRPQYRNGAYGRLYAGGGTDDRYNLGGIYSRSKNNMRYFIVGQSNNINEQNFSISDLTGGGASFMMRGGGGRGGSGGGGRSSGGSGTNISDFLVPMQGGITQTHAGGVNFSTQKEGKVGINGSYFYNEAQNNTRQELRRLFVLPQDSGQVYNELQTSRSISRNHRLNMRVEYTLDSNNAFIFEPRFTLQDYTGSYQLGGSTSNDLRLLNTTSNTFTSDLLAWNVSGDLLWQHKFRRERRTLSLNVVADQDQKTGDSRLLASNAFYGENTQPSSSQDQARDLDQDSWGIRLNAEYTEPAGKYGMMKLLYGWRWRDNDARKETYGFSPLSQQYSELDTLLSSTFASAYQAHQAGLGYAWHKDKSTLNLSLNAQQATLQNAQQFPYAAQLRRDFQNLLPGVTFRHEISKTESLRLMYRTNTQEPSIDQLQEVIDNRNPLQLKTGNPNLSQQYQHRLFTRYNRVNVAKGRNLFFMVGGTTSPNYLGNSTLIARADTTLPEGIFMARGTQLSRTENLPGYYTLRSFASYGFTLDSLRYNLNFNGGLTYARTPGKVNNALNYSNSTIFTLGFTIGTNISQKIDLNLNSFSNFSRASNTLQTQLNTNYFSQNTRFAGYWNFWKGFFIQAELNHNLYTGLSQGFDQNFLLLNGAAGVKFLPKQQAELRLSVFDLLGQNTSISRTVTDIAIEDNMTQVLKTYWMATFTWKFNTYAKNMAPTPGEGPPPGMMFNPQFRRP
ncbi:MAG: outer membrane beta-barrel protein [Bacteroidetes bacterium]|nr:outer membrane beta-barrel protein [Bacteroidota bacterium]